MSNSGRKINYAVRPAKNIERKMMRDFFARLSHLGRIEDYRYVGFGSKYFADFIVFHRFLNISKMVSIEGDIHNKERYEFNKPYPDIVMEWGHSSTVLPRLVYSDQRTIYWLDYDKLFDVSMLADTAVITEAASSGSVFCISFNCQAPDFADGSVEGLKDELTKQVGKKHVPSTLECRGWKLRHTIFLKNCVTNEITSVLNRRNLTLDPTQRLRCEQKLFFTYADGAPMATIAFIFLDQEDSLKIHDCRHADLYFTRNGNEAFDISTPNLTIKEIRHLIEIRPDQKKLNTKVFTEKDADSVWQNYRYFPGFAEVESF